jgi:hypothetical protein
MNTVTLPRTAAIVASIFCAFITVGMSVAPAIQPAAALIA